MVGWLTENEASIRLTVFLSVFAIMALWEILLPRRKPGVSKPRRWLGNLAIVVLNSIILRFVFPAAAVGAALFTASQGWGVFNYLDWPFWIEVVAAMLILDLVVYLQHVMIHVVPIFWRLHRMHHSDLDFDVTTGVRFHPVEILLSMCIKFVVIFALGPAVVAVLLFEILLNATSMFNHSNVRLPLSVDRWLRLIVVTPDMHRVHHSAHYNETNSNFGFNFPWWDRWMGTYIDQPTDGHQKMVIGLSEFRNTRECSDLTGMLAIPMKSAGLNVQTAGPDNK